MFLCASASGMLRENLFECVSEVYFALFNAISVIKYVFELSLKVSVDARRQNKKLIKMLRKLGEHSENADNFGRGKSLPPPVSINYVCSRLTVCINECRTLVVKDPDRFYNLISSSFDQPGPLHKILL